MGTSEDPERRPVISARQARQGVIEHNVRARARIQSGRDRCRVCHYLDGLFRLKTCNQPQGGLAQSRQGAATT